MEDCRAKHMTAWSHRVSTSQQWLMSLWCARPSFNIWKPINSLFVMQNSTYTCCMLKLGLFVIISSSRGHSELYHYKAFPQLENTERANVRLWFTKSTTKRAERDLRGVWSFPTTPTSCICSILYLTSEQARATRTWISKENSFIEDELQLPLKLWLFWSGKIPLLSYQCQISPRSSIQPRIL